MQLRHAQIRHAQLQVCHLRGGYMVLHRIAIRCRAGAGIQQNVGERRQGLPLLPVCSLLVAQQEVLHVEQICVLSMLALQRLL